MFGIWPIFQQADKMQGILVEGDSTMPRTRWWNHAYLVLFGWKLGTVLEIKERSQPFRVGYKSQDGPARISPDECHPDDRVFAVRNGHEDCVFFAVGRDGRELPLCVVRKAPLRDLVPRICII